MKFKTCIAAFLVMIFLGKIVSMDAKYMGVIFHRSEVPLVNKMCPKKQLQKDSFEVSTADSFTSAIEFDFLCNSAFDLQFHYPVITFSEDNFWEYTYRSPGVTPIAGKKFYPPPRV